MRNNTIKNDIQVLSECLKYTEELFGLDFLENPDFNSIGKNKVVSQQITSNTPRIVNIYNKAKKDLIKNIDSKEGNQIHLANTTPEFVQLISTLKYGLIEEIFLKELILLLKSSEYNDYNSARQEVSIYQKYKRSGYNISKLSEDTTLKPDFIINSDSYEIYIECKSIIPEVIKLTPRLSSFRENILSKLKKKKISGLINVILDTNRPDEYEPEIEELIDKSLIAGQNSILHGENSKLQFSNIEVSLLNNKLNIVIPTGVSNVGGLELEFVDNNIFAYGINFLPFLPNDYKKALSRQMSKANKQISSNGEGILHIQFPELSSSSFIDLIADHGHRIQDFLKSRSLSAVILEIPSLTNSIDSQSHIYPNIEVVYFKPSQLLLHFTKANPFWLDRYQLIESDSTSRFVVIDFSLNSSSNSFILYLCDSDLTINIKIYIIENRILLESIIDNKCSVMLGNIPHELLQENNKLGFNIRQNDYIYINGKKVLISKTINK